ncbi:anti-sigma factor [Trujillonella endophytica]|uniref:Anti-sigma-K factor rskA n=1 Tax=Trujillonella endophytica TaxID=673521 RepID=A0A1H8TYT4_9ACTN|nr:anti-sigma factor [Trujillella endophytica]SEO96192.1 Anti-sigma-K factor rskA [Trujillella endophytica]
MSRQRTWPEPDGHETFDELAVGWALHALEPEDEVVFDGHLPGCSRCARTVAETAEVMGALAVDLPASAPDEALRDRLRAAVERSTQVSPPAPAPSAPAPSAPAPSGDRGPSGGPLPGPTPVPVPGAARGGATAATGFPAYREAGRAGEDPVPRSPWRRVVPNALAAAGIAAILGLGSWIVVLDDARDEAVAGAEEQAGVVASLLEPGTATIAPLTGDGGRVATVVARDAEVQVVAHGLPVNDTERETYVVWGIDDGPVALGTFDVVRSQMDVRTVGSTTTGLGDFDGYAISLERGRQAPPAPTAVVAASG